MATGIAAIAAGPLMGRVADAVGKYPTFFVGTSIGIGLVVYYTHLDVTPLWFVIALNIVLFTCISARMVSSQALSSAIPDPPDRGAYMSISSSLQQFAGGVASYAAGLLVSQRTADAPLEHYDRLGYVVSAAMIATLVFMYKVNRVVLGGANPAATSTPAQAPAVVSEPDAS
jgi:MFS family permease